MKKLLLTLIMSVVLGGTMFAQYYENTENYNPNGYTTYFDEAYPFSPGDYEDVDYPSAYLQRNGQLIGASDNWDDYEVAAFVDGVLRGFIFMTNIYVEEGGLPMFEGIFIYRTASNEEVSFKVYDHSTGMEYDCTTNLTIVTGDDSNFYGVYDDPEGISDESLIISFTTEEPQIVTFTKDIVGYGDSDGGYYLIASPVVEEVTPGAENGFLTTAYDLYFFDGSQEGQEWRNYKVDAFTLTNGKGYLYASQEDTQLTFTGTPYSGDGVVGLEFNEGTDFGGWNLVGNPFAEQALPNREYLILNTGEEGGDFIPGEGGVEAMEGIMVYAEAEGDSVTFIPSNGEGGEDKLTINLTKSCVRGTVDRAIVNFGEGGTLPKFQMNPNHTKVYIPQDGTDYAVVSAPEMGEMPVNFKAETNGSYTMSFGSENVTFSYLHLIDNLTGADVDLLATPSYTFDASTTDYASRFRLVFATGGDSDGDSFAFFSNGSFIVSNEGEATLQVVDVMGRIMKSENISGSASVKVDAASGVYMLRLVNGNDVKVQKVVVE